jgi:hypothetical protein
MRTRRQATIRDLRVAIDCLPVPTRIAMLEGMRSNEIIVGAYANGGGVCPMLAAHRAGGRTSLISFAKAWDGLAFRGARVGVARRATDRELLILRTHLEASLLDEDGASKDLGAAMAEHRDLLARHGRRSQTRERARRADSSPAPVDRVPPVDPVRPGDRDRSSELRVRPGWAWMRVFRRYDDYERALELVQSEHEALQHGREREPVG